MCIIQGNPKLYSANSLNYTLLHSSKNMILVVRKAALSEGTRGQGPFLAHMDTVFTTKSDTMFRAPRCLSGAD